MQFVHQALTWGFLLALLPLLIHLINLVRRRRVRWAAMDFLLQSHKRHRTWIWLKQLMLLLARMAVVVIVVAMLAQWITQRQWFSLFGGQATHHYVILDDSFSMTDRVGGATAFDRASRALQNIASQAMSRETTQKFTVLRFSRTAGVDPSAAGADSAADLHAEIVDSNFDLFLEERRLGFAPTELAVGPHNALRIVKQMIDASSDEESVVYLLSDFREKDWANPADARRLLREFSEASTDIHFVSCNETQQANLAIVDVSPADDTRAAGVPLFVNVTVRNFGREAVRKLPVRVRTRYFDPQSSAAAEPGKLEGKDDEPPTVVIDEIGPGQVASARFQVFFPQPGQHVVEAELPDDAVTTDNRRWCVIDLPEAEHVLVIDGSPGQRNAFFLAAVFAPGQRANTGIRPDVQPAAFLRDATAESLARYRAIYLLDVDRVDEHVVPVLEAFVRAGGGIGIFVGDQVNIAFYNQYLYRDGEGLFPVELGRSDLLPEELFENKPDLEVAEHPIFGIFLSERNPFINLVRVDRYLKPAETWAPSPDSTIEVLAKLRNQQPLAVERKLGDGRVIAFLTSLAPQWNNWAQDPSFVVVLLQLQSYLAAPTRLHDERLVGSPLEIRLDAKTYRRDLLFVVPGEDELPWVVKETADPAQVESPVLVATLRSPAADGDTGTARSGIYEAWPETIEGVRDPRRFAVNVNAQESDLAIAPTQTLLTRLEPVKIEFRNADQYGYDFADQAGVNRSMFLMFLLIALLLGEQVLAYVASFHAAPGALRT